MKLLKILICAVLMHGVVIGFESASAAEHQTPNQSENLKKAKPYPLKTCLISGEKLGEMGHPYVFTHEGQEIKLCCKGCLKEFKKDPAMHLKKLKDATKELK